MLNDERDKILESNSIYEHSLFFNIEGCAGWVEAIELEVKKYNVSLVIGLSKH